MSWIHFRIEIKIWVHLGSQNHILKFYLFGLISKSSLGHLHFFMSSSFPCFISTQIHLFMSKNIFLLDLTYFYAISYRVNSSQTGAFFSASYSHSWVLIIYLSSWTFLYSDFLISSLFLHPLTSFQFQSWGCRNHLSLIGIAIYFLGAFVWLYHLLLVYFLC